MVKYTVQRIRDALRRTPKSKKQHSTAQHSAPNTRIWNQIEWQTQTQTQSSHTQTQTHREIDAIHALHAISTEKENTGWLFFNWTDELLKMCVSAWMINALKLIEWHWLSPMNQVTCLCVCARARINLQYLANYTLGSAYDRKIVPQGK